MILLPCQVFYSGKIIPSGSFDVPRQLAMLQAEHLRAAQELALVCRRFRALLRTRPLPLQLSFRAPLRAPALDALLSPKLSGRIDALHLWGWDAPLSGLEQGQLLGVLQSQAGSLRRLALEGYPAALLGTPGVDLRCLHQLTKLELSTAKALQLVPATLPQGLVRVVCTMDNTGMGAWRHITWATDAVSAPPGCLPHLDWMHMRVGGPFSLEAAHAWPGVHVCLTACRGAFACDNVLAADTLQRSAGRGIFSTARSVAISGYGLSLYTLMGHIVSLDEPDGQLRELLFPVTGPLTEVVFDPCKLRSAQRLRVRRPGLCHAAAGAHQSARGRVCF